MLAPPSAASRHKVHCVWAGLVWGADIGDLRVSGLGLGLEAGNGFRYQQTANNMADAAAHELHRHWGQSVAVICATNARESRRRESVVRGGLNKRGDLEQICVTPTITFQPCSTLKQTNKRSAKAAAELLVNRSSIRRGKLAKVEVEIPANITGKKMSRSEGIQGPQLFNMYLHMRRRLRLFALFWLSM